MFGEPGIENGIDAQVDSKGHNAKAGGVSPALLRQKAIIRNRNPPHRFVLGHRNGADALNAEAT
jgi:hypothetical protein